MVAHKPPITDAVDILHRRYYARKPERAAALEAERINAEIAQAVYDLRITRGNHMAFIEVIYILRGTEKRRTALVNMDQIEEVRCGDDGTAFLQVAGDSEKTAHSYAAMKAALAVGMEQQTGALINVADLEQEMTEAPVCSGTGGKIP